MRHVELLARHARWDRRDGLLAIQSVSLLLDEAFLVVEVQIFGLLFQLGHLIEMVIKYILLLLGDSQ